MIFSEFIAKKYFNDQIVTDMVCEATVADDRKVKLNKSLELAWRDYDGKYFSTRVWIMRCNVPAIASLEFLERMGLDVDGRTPKHVLKQLENGNMVWHQQMVVIVYFMQVNQIVI